MGLVSHRFNQVERTTTEWALLVWLRGDAQNETTKIKNQFKQSCLGMTYYCKLNDWYSRYVWGR